MTRSLFRSVYFQVLVAITARVPHGVFAPATATAMKPLGDGFIKLALILGIDRFMSEARALTNVIGKRSRDTRGCPVDRRSGFGSNDRQLRAGASADAETTPPVDALIEN
jgi:hypothetical protein